MLGLVRGAMVLNPLSDGGEGESRKPDRRSMEEQGGEGGFVLKVNPDGAGLVSIVLLIWEGIRLVLVDKGLVLIEGTKGLPE